METTPTNFLLHTFFLIFLTLTHFINYKTAAATAAAASAIFQIQSSSSSSSSCNGSIADCNEDLEMLMESEISRRFLDEDSRRISYKTLNPDQPSCNGKRGNSYNSAGNCVPRSSNPYHRDCSPIYGCRKSA